MSTATYVIDASHSHAAFSVRHMMISNVRGEFQQLSGEVSYDPEHPESTTVAVTIQAASVNTREEKRDAHLRSADSTPRTTRRSPSARRARRSAATGSC
jgi:polyisoprenoid-binding protein YceI